MSRVRWVVLEPLDTLTIRDGRAFNDGVQLTTAVRTPAPSTVAGAIGAAFHGNPRDVRGPVLVRRRGTGADATYEPLFPVPRDVMASDAPPHERRGSLLTPQPIPAGVACDLNTPSLVRFSVV